MKEAKNNKIAKRLIWIAFVVSALVSGGHMYRSYLIRHTPPTAAQPTQTSPEAGERSVILFFAAEDGNALVREVREIDACDDLATCIDDLLQELANGPLGDLKPTIPPTTTVRSVAIDGDTAVINFGHELVEGLPGGSSAESAAVYAIVDSITATFPQIKRVKITIEGEKSATLKEHVDIRQPLEPDFSRERLPK
ncbi:MAG TPA: GerMN domain-containing protein [Geobacterales bacterium]|nr:GerMN domain-containing protein [Geobacterales bacterium]